MNLQLQILTALRNVHPLMMPVPALWAESRMAVVPQPDRPSFDHALRVLEDEKKQIVVVAGEDKTRAKITDDGLARLAEAGV